MRLPPEILERAVLDHGRRDAGDHVGAVGVLAVQARVHRERLARRQVEQRRDDRRRAEIEGEGVTALGRVAGLDRDQLVVDDDRSHVVAGLPEDATELAKDAKRRLELQVVHRREHALEIRYLILEVRLVQDEMALLHRGAQDHVAADTRKRGLGARLQRRHLDDEVVERVRPAREAPAVGELVRRERARVEIRDADRTVDDAHLALLARAVPAAGRVDRDRVPAGCVEDGRSAGNPRLAEQARLGRGVEEAQQDSTGAGLLLHPVCALDQHLACCRRLLGAVGRDPARAPLVVVEQHIARPHRLDTLEESARP